MERIPLYDNICKYGYFIENKEDFELQASRLEDNDIIFIIDNCISKELIRQKYDNKIVSIEKADALKYMNPNMPMWLENEEIYNKVLNMEYDKILPQSAEVVPSLNCSFRCEQCSYRPTKEKEGIWSDRRTYKDEKFYMSRETMDIIINKLHKAGTKNIVFTGGGEPLSNSEVTLFGMELAKEKKLTFGLYTNGFYLNDYICKRICELDPLFVRISVYGLNENEFEKYTKIPSKNFYRVISNIKKLISFKERYNSNFQLSLSFLVNPILVNNDDDIEKFFENNFSREELRKLFMVRFTPTVDYYTAKQHSAEYFEKMFANIENYAKKSKEYLNIVTYRHRLNDLYKLKEYDKCRGSGFYAEVGPDAKMYLCCEELTDSKYELGTLKKYDIEQIFNDERRKKILNQISTKKCKECPSVCKPHEINKQLAAVEELVLKGKIELINEWRNDLIKKSINSEYFPGKLNAFES